MENESLSLEDAVTWTRGKLVNNTKAKLVSSFDFIGTDSRSDLTKKLFVPLRGDVFDAHDFIHSAIEKGCTGVLFDNKSKTPLKLDLDGPIALIEVEDTLLALQEMAQGYRKKLKKIIIGITGSAGKTTAKEFTSQILNTKSKTYASQGSLNNHWGVPFSLLNMRSTDCFGVIEMGMDRYGEIQRLVEIADPDIVVVTMVGHAHFEHFGSQENIAKAKNEIYLYSKKPAMRVFNLDNPFTKKMRDNFLNANGAGPVFLFSTLDRRASVFMQLKNVSAQGLELEGTIGTQPGQALVPVFGRHNITNVLVAATLALATGMAPAQIWISLSKLKTNWGRNQLLKADCGAQVIFDGYNANPDSMDSLIKNVHDLQVSGKRILILGEMLGLGDSKDKFHSELAEKISKSKFDQVVFYGPSWQTFKDVFAKASTKTQLFVSEKMDPVLINQLKSDYKPGDLIAIKGSRGMKTEKAVSILVQAFSHEKI